MEEDRSLIKGNISVPSQGDRCVLAADGIITRVPGLQAASGGQSWANDEGSSECRRCFDKSLCKFTSPAKLPITGRALHVQVDSTRSSGGSVAGPEPHGHVDVSCKAGGTVEGMVYSLVVGVCEGGGLSHWLYYSLVLYPLPSLPSATLPQDTEHTTDTSTRESACM